jgi:hypothetical protein
MTPRGNNLGGPGSTEPGRLSGHIEDWGEFAVDYLDGRVDPEHKAALERHLAGCSGCASRMAAQQGMITFLQRTPQESAPEDLEDRVLGELLFPTRPGAEPAFRGAKSELRPSSTWSRRLRPWVPVTAVVFLILAGIVTFGVLRQSSGNPTAFREETTTRVADQAAGETAAPSFAGSVTTSAAAATTTAAGGSETTTTNSTKLSVASGPAVIRDAKEMVNMLESASGPAYIAFEPLSSSESATTTSSPTETSATVWAGTDSTTTDGTATATTVAYAPPEVTLETIPAAMVDEVVAEVVAFTGLEQLAPEFSMGGPTFAAFVSREQLKQFLDLLFSIKASVRVDLGLRMDPETDRAGNAGQIAEHKAQLPVLLAQVTPQPAVIRYSFTTSTLVPPDDTGTSVTIVTPDDEGTHVLIVIFVRR